MSDRRVKDGQVEDGKDHLPVVCCRCNKPVKSLIAEAKNKGVCCTADTGENLMFLKKDVNVLFKSKQEKFVNCKELFFSCDDLIIYLGKFIATKDLKQFSNTNKALQKFIRKSNVLCKNKLKQLIDMYYYILKFDLPQIEEFFSSHATKHTWSNSPYAIFIKIPVKGENSSRFSIYCLSLEAAKNLFLLAQNYPDDDLDTMMSIKLELMFAHPDFCIINDLFGDFLLLRKLKRLMSFSDFVVDNKFMENVKFVGRLPINKISAKSSKDRSWKRIKICYGRNGYRLKRVRQENIQNNFQLVDACTFNENLEIFYKISAWHEYINWEHFSIMGGAIFNSLVDCKVKRNKQFESDIDLFSIEIDFEEFIEDVLRFESKVEADNNITYIKQKNRTNTLVTFYLWCGSNYFRVKIQFVYIASYSNECTMLNGFDMAAVQLSYNWVTKQLRYSTGFEDFVISGSNYVYMCAHTEDLCFDLYLFRIIKYFKKGIHYINVLSNIDIKILQKGINNIKYDKTRLSSRFRSNNKLNNICIRKKKMVFK